LTRFNANSISNQNKRNLYNTSPANSPDSDGRTPSSRRALHRRRIDKHFDELQTYDPQNELLNDPQIRPQNGPQIDHKMTHERIIN
jgi:hypothetical protein